MKLTLGYIPRPVPVPGALFRGRRVLDVTWNADSNPDSRTLDISLLDCVTGITLTLAPPPFETVFDAPPLLPECEERPESESGAAS